MANGSPPGGPVAADPEPVAVGERGRGAARGKREDARRKTRCEPRKSAYTARSSGKKVENLPQSKIRPRLSSGLKSKSGGSSGELDD